MMKRVIYKSNPIIETILQITFPKILDLNVNEPVKFQENIKDFFPVYDLSIEQHQEISVQGNPNDFVPSIVQKQAVRNHAFISQDGKYKINLTNSFISISTCEYTKWEDFIDRFSIPFKKFVEIYNPPFFERIGLRYIDAISRKKLHLENTRWNELIKSSWLGAFAFEKDENKVLNSGMDIEYLLPNGVSRAKIHSGIGRINECNEKVFIFDVDLIHVSTINIKDVNQMENYLHSYVKNILETFITDKLHNAMGPEEL